MDKILILPSQEYVFLKKACQYFQKKDHTKLYMVSSSKKYKPYISFVGNQNNIVQLPNFYKQQDWESQSYHIAFINKLITECEKINGLPINRILLTLERDIGRGFSKNNYYWPERPISKKVLKNDTYAYSVVMRMFYFVYQNLDSIRPNLCLGGLTGGLNSVFSWVCHYMDIPFISCDVSGIFPKHHFWVSGWGSYADQFEQSYVALFNKEVVPSKQSIAFIDAFRNKPQLEPLRDLSLKQPSFRTILKNIFKFTKIKFISYLKSDSLAEAKPILSNAKQAFRSYFLRPLQNKLYRRYSEDELMHMTYVYYPMHVDPEGVLNLRAPFWHNQLNTIQLIAQNLPYNCKLLVKEYVYNLGRRSTRYLRSIKQLPGVVLIDALDNQYKYITHANLIVTVNGTTGFEGLLLKKQVLTLSRSLYDVTGYCKKITTSNLHEIILDAVNNTQNYTDIDRAMALFLDTGNKIGISNNASDEEEYCAIMDAVSFYTNSIRKNKKLEFDVLVN